MAICTGLSVPQMMGRNKAEMAPMPTPRNSATLPTAPAYSGPNRSPACAGLAAAKATAAVVATSCCLETLPAGASCFRARIVM